MIEQLAQQIFQDISKLGAQVNADLASSKLKPLIDSKLRQLNLVTREEFDAQQSVLEKTREKLHQLEQKLDEIEKEKADAKSI